MRHLSLAILFTAVLGCRAVAAPLPQERPPLPTASPPYVPGPASASGTVIRVQSGGVVVQTVDGELDVDLSGVRSVWKETQVAPSALEVGDDLQLNGARVTGAFRASYVWANIGRFDGVVRALAGQRLELVALPPSQNSFEIELSPYLEVIHVDGSPATVADLKPGMTVGGVKYRPRNETPRATKIWL